MSGKTRRCRLGFEALESRCTPARLIGGSAIVYKDIDGDMVRVSLTAPILTAGNVDQVFRFDSGGVNGSTANSQQLQQIDVTPLGGAALNLGISVILTSSIGSADHQANIGAIISPGPLANVQIAGDLGRIFASGSGSLATAVLSLNVNSIGAMGVATQPAGGDLHSIIVGRLGELKVRGSVVNAFIDVQNGTGGIIGSIGDVTINGSLVGGDADNSGSIKSAGDVGRVQVRGDFQGGLGQSSGTVEAGSNVTSVTVDGNVIGGGGVGSGNIRGNDFGPIRIGHDLIGGAGGVSAWLTGGNLSSFTLGGSIIGQGFSGGGLQFFGNVGTMQIGGDMRGGSGNGSASIQVYGKLTRFELGGSMLGGAGQNTALLYGDGDADTILIHGDIHGGTNFNSGCIDIQGVVQSVVVKGNLTGGDNPLATSLNQLGVIGGGDLLDVGIRGNVTAGTSTGGGPLTHSGAIVAQRTIQKLTIRGDVVGNAGTPVCISARGQGTPTATVDMAIDNLSIRGDVSFLNVLAGYSHITFNGGENGNAQIGEVTIGGNWTSSNLVAGMDKGADGMFGTNDDVFLPTDVTGGSIAKIERVIFKKSAKGTIGGTDHFGITSHEILFVKQGAFFTILQSGPGNDDVALGTTGDFTAHEVPGPSGGGSA